ncbi:ATP-binding cassette domain-containing protein [Heliobacterium gestii]|uniref:ATP-binding cassette domain-containing protein n=1 Tax=Heliomicrobium gestii TaxID=2699 RepID=A0A845L8C5_HELGE|nr:ABC transporter ATP-binding protein [Heliomicrobium gestii]MBM7865591.1 putative ABC transport system ATP-binding protein [Heliomicrobium gestii]MZP41841.1 ATP-binding cassette domain-containing protein [Heliomicrobium gestii]
MILEASNVTKRYGAQTILQSLSLQLDRGQSLALLGPSGSGKTTLLSLLGLLMAPSSGEIRLLGQLTGNLKDSDLSLLRNRHIGIVFQSAQLIGPLTVWENVLLPAHLAGKSEEKRSRAGELLESLRLSGRINHRPHQLSYGQKRRVALARALLMEPSLLLADEPTNDLDPLTAKKVTELLLDWTQRGGALVVATHDRELARSADRRFVIEEGRLVEAEPAKVAGKEREEVAAS